MKYSKATRELAAVRCQVIADYWSRTDIGHPDAYEDFTDDWPCKRLCGFAYDEADRKVTQDFGGRRDIAESWAEAEALIRTGWSPS